MPHHRTGDRVVHLSRCTTSSIPLQDAIEGITHSLCSLEYEIHRPLYDWVVREANVTDQPPQPDRVRPPEPRAAPSCPSAICAVWWRNGVVSRLGRSRACPRWPPCAAEAIRAAAIHDFMSRVGVAKSDSTVEGNLLDHCVREASERHRARAPWPCVRPAEGHARPTGLRVSWTSWRWRTTPTIPRWARARVHLRPRAVHRTRGLHGGTASRSSSASPPAGRFA